MRGGPRRLRAVRPPTAALICAAVLLGAASVRAQDTLTCGVPFARTLQAGGTDTFNVSTPPGSQVVIQSSAVSTSFGPRDMLLTGPGGFSIESVTGIIGPFTGRADVLTLQIKQLIGTTGGEYTVELNVVSGDAANCGRQLQCGATPDGTVLTVPGEVDSFQTPPLTAGEMVTFKVNYLQS